MNTTACRAILLPGSVLPAAPAYGALVAALHERLGDTVEAVPKDLEVYAGPTPPDDYSLDTEVDGVVRTARELGWDSFHLVGYSGGGASALAVAARHPEMRESLALLEPAMILFLTAVVGTVILSILAAMLSIYDLPI